MIAVSLGNNTVDMVLSGFSHVCVAGRVVPGMLLCLWSDCPHWQVYMYSCSGWCYFGVVV